MSPPDVTRADLVVGCGYLGRRVAARWLAAGRRVAALTRGNAAGLAESGVEPITGDVLDPPSLSKLPAAATVLYAVGLDRSAGRSMREVYVAGLGHVLDTLPPCGRFVYVSSTSVYGQNDGVWVDENSPTEPTEENGKIVLDAERLLRSKLPGAIILRFAGIYGPGRYRKQLLSGEPFAGDADRWVSLIHVDDGTEAVLAAEARGEPGQTYNICDDEPVTRRAFYTHLAELLHAPPARFDHRPEPGSPNRRVSNARAKAALGWRPRFPSYREGLVTVL
jgi:nucleoside-diphosphate-sugar epimerase